MGKDFKISTGMLFVTLLQVLKTIASLATVKAKAVKRKVNCRVLATAESGGPYLRSESHLVDVTFMWTTKDSYSRWLSEDTHEVYLSRKLRKEGGLHQDLEIITGTLVEKDTNGNVVYCDDQVDTANTILLSNIREECEPAVADEIKKISDLDEALDELRRNSERVQSSTITNQLKAVLRPKVEAKNLGQLRTSLRSYFQTCEEFKTLCEPINKNQLLNLLCACGLMYYLSQIGLFSTMVALWKQTLSFSADKLCDFDMKAANDQYTGIIENEIGEKGATTRVHLNSGDHAGSKQVLSAEAIDRRIANAKKKNQRQDRHF